jgi:NitT/TauT family transport system ATP-binding protein
LTGGSLSVSSVTKEFADVVAVRQISFNARAGEFVCIVGPSGCGKTTLLRLIAGLEAPTDGLIVVDGERVVGPSRSRGVIFQEYALFPWRTVIGNVVFGLEIKGLAKQERLELARRYVDFVGLTAFANSYPHELSGGMKQRVAIARVLANNPTMILADEPFAALDTLTRYQMQAEFLRIWQVEGKTMLFVTHNVEEAVFLADKIVLMSEHGLKRIVSVPFTRPRSRTEPEFALFRDQIVADMEIETASNLHS